MFDGHMVPLVSGLSEVILIGRGMRHTCFGSHLCNDSRRNDTRHFTFFNDTTRSSGLAHTGLVVISAARCILWGRISHMQISFFAVSVP